MVECRNCIQDYGLCGDCYEGSLYKGMNNANRIRNMSDEELAEFINTKTACDCCSAKPCKSEEHCTVDILQWLKSEVKE